MQDNSGTFTTSRFYFGNFHADLLEIIGDRQTVIITDEHVYDCHWDKFTFAEVIVIPAGEQSKSFDTIQHITEQLLACKVYRKSLIIGVGGGVVTDIVGYMATIYMRGVSFGFIPTSLLAMVDAAIGGKNGINFGLHKNMLGTFSQPEFIAIDPTYLHTLPTEEWSNGFAEIIKYACLFDEKMLDELSTKNIAYYKQNDQSLLELIYKCAAWKDRLVQQDEKEEGMRKLLNLGHTCGHAIETLYSIPHGQAVSLGMVVASYISEEFNDFPRDASEEMRTALCNFDLPLYKEVDIDKILALVEMDKKKNKNGVDFITLKAIAQPEIKTISLNDIRKGLEKFHSAGNN